MYKLVAIGGKLRGQEFILQDGENIIGRDPESDIEIPINGVSKRHLSVTVTNDVAYVKDLGSSNGTFVNGAIVKEATVESGDKIALPDVILQVVYVKEKKVIIKKSIESAADDEDEGFMKPGAPPKSLFGKILHLFKFKIMPVIHGINEEYEWRSLFGILLSVFIAIIVAVSIYPIMKDNSNLLILEAAKRGSFYADVIAKINARALEQRKLDQVDTSIIRAEDGVVSFELFDLDGRIVRPIELLNEYISDPFSIKARDWFSGQNNQRNVYRLPLDDGEIGIAQKIDAYNSRLGYEETVGVIAIRFKPSSLAVEAIKNQKAYLEALVTAAIVAIIFFGMIYYMTIRPIEEVKYQMDEILNGKRPNLDTKLLMREMKPLKDSISSALLRLRELQGGLEDGDMMEVEDDGPYVEQLIDIMEGSGVPTIVLNSEKLLKKISTDAEDLTGIRETASLDMGLLDIAREKGFAATLIELCDMSANNNGHSEHGAYELSGNEYQIHVKALMGKDNFAKGFYITFLRD